MFDRLSRALRWLHVLAPNSDWFIALFASAVIGQSDYECEHAVKMVGRLFVMANTFVVRSCFGFSHSFLVKT